VTEDQIPKLHAEFVASTRKRGRTKKRASKSDVVSADFHAGDWTQLFS
jgi:hypothetical protein